MGFVFLAMLVGILIANVGFRWSAARRALLTCSHNGHQWTTREDGLYCRVCLRPPTPMTFRR